MIDDKNELSVEELCNELQGLIAGGLPRDTKVKVWLKGGNIRTLKAKSVAFNPAFGLYVKTTDAK